jgi:signal peptidase I
MTDQFENNVEATPVNSPEQPIQVSSEIANAKANSTIAHEVLQAQNEHSSEVANNKADSVALNRKELRSGHKRATKLKLLRDFAIIVVVALILSAVIKAFIFQPFLVPSGSMEDTLQPNDKIVVSKISLFEGIKRGDIVVFHDTKGWLKQSNTPGHTPEKSILERVVEFLGFVPEDDNSYLVKRVIGIPGDHVACAGADAPIKVNGHPISDEPYLKPYATHSRMPFDVTVPDGMMWVMGDNRPLSADSRLNTDKLGKGFIDESDVVGKVFAIMSPQDRMMWIEDQTHIFADVPDVDNTPKLSSSNPEHNSGDRSQPTQNTEGDISDTSN